MRRSLQSINARELVLQMISVTFGVLLALWLDEWRQGVGERRETATALQSLANEIDFNRRALARTIDHYRALVEQVEALAIERGPEAPVTELPGYSGISPPVLRESSFRLSMAAGILPRLPHEQAEVIALTYSLQETYTGLTDLWTASFLSPGNRNAGMLGEMLQSWLPAAEELGRFYIAASDGLPPPQRLEIR